MLLLHGCVRNGHSDEAHKRESKGTCAVDVKSQWAGTVPLSSDSVLPIRFPTAWAAPRANLNLLLPSVNSPPLLERKQDLLISHCLE